jgi:hypothetical protein
MKQKDKEYLGLFMRNRLGSDLKIEIPIEPESINWEFDNKSSYSKLRILIYIVILLVVCPIGSLFFNNQYYRLDVM